MPNLKEIVSLKTQNNNTVTLYREGIFYKAYNESAFLFCQNVHIYEVKCKFVKTVGDWVLSLGFPCASIGKIHFQVTQQELDSVNS